MTDYRMGLQFVPERLTNGTLPNLEDHHGRKIEALHFRLFFVGSIWETANNLSQDRERLAGCLSAALTSDHLNSVLGQYLDNKKATAEQDDDSAVIEQAWSSSVCRQDVEAWIVKLLEASIGPRIPKETDFPNFAALFVLAPGTILRGDKPSDPSSLEGVAAFHNFFDDPNNQGRRVYYAVTVLSDGQNGAAKPGWQPWKNAGAALYHEAAEIRTDPDYDPTPNTGTWYVDIPPDHMGMEIGDLPILSADPTPQKMMQEVEGPNGTKVPIQYLWSNGLRRPWDTTGPAE